MNICAYVKQRTSSPALSAGPAKFEAEPLPVKRIHGSLLVGHEHPAGALVELLEITKTSPGATGVLHHPPEACGGRPPRPEGRGFHAPGWLRCGPCGATPFPPRPERRGSSGGLDGGETVGEIRRPPAVWCAADSPGG